jgi:hypothetical protein
LIYSTPSTLSGFFAPSTLLPPFPCGS